MIFRLPSAHPIARPARARVSLPTDGVESTERVSQSAIQGEAGIPLWIAGAPETRSDLVRARGRAPGAILLTRDALLHFEGNWICRCRRSAESRAAGAGQIALRS